MIHIGICEDEGPQLQYISQLLRNFGEGYHYAIDVDQYENAEQLLFAYAERPYDLLILDIQMPGMNGMELAREIRNQDNQVKILFLTGISDYAMEGYEVGAVRYLLKPIQEQAFINLMQQLVQELLAEKETYLVVTVKGETKRIASHDILYMEARGHYVALHTRSEIVEWKDSLSSWKQWLEERSYALLRRGLYVNMECVGQIQKEWCVLDTGEKLPVSKSCYHGLNQAFIQYYCRKEE